MRNASKLASLFALGLALLGGPACRDSSASGSDTPAAPSATETPVPDVVLPGIDISAMTPRERHEWSRLATTLLAPCPSVPVPVAQCVEEKRACGSCTMAAKWVARAVRGGMSEDQIGKAYKDRFDPSGVKTIPIAGSPTKGPDDAPVTIVEFADFECPHCREAVPRIDGLMAAHPGKIRLVYKVFTLQFHMHGEDAARSALAAGVQGKFWEMEHLLFERQQHLETSDLEEYARGLRLDLAKWKADMGSQAIKDRISQDHKLGEELKLQGTPTIYINGRPLELEADEPLEALLEERVSAELGQQPGAAPSSSAAPAASTPDAGHTGATAVTASASAVAAAPAAPSSPAPPPSAKPH